MEVMVAHLLLATRMSAMEIVSPVNGDSFFELSEYAIVSRQRRSPKAHHTVGPPLPERSRRGLPDIPASTNYTG